MKRIIILLLIGVIGLAAGFGIAKATIKTTTTKLLTDTFYESQSASVNGRITNVDSDKKTITIKNSKNEERTLSVSDTIAISKPGQINQSGLPTQTSSNLKDIELNKEVGIMLSVINGDYKVTTITSAPALPSQGSINQPTAPSSPLGSPPPPLPPR